MVNYLTVVSAVYLELLKFKDVTGCNSTNQPNGSVPVTYRNATVAIKKASKNVALTNLRKDIADIEQIDQSAVSALLR